MSEKNETIADITAEMRKYASDYYQRSAEWGGDKGNPGMFYLQMAQAAKVFAERIEEAYRVETLRWVEANAGLAKLIDLAKIPASDTAQMREALEQIANLMDRILVRTELDDEIHRIALEAQNATDGALLQPPRNCDVGTLEEQQRRFAKYCRVHSDAHECGLGYAIGDPKVKCPAYKTIDCQLVWAQMPYEEGGEK